MRHIEYVRIEKEACLFIFLGQLRPAILVQRVTDAEAEKSFTLVKCIGKAKHPNAMKIKNLL